MGHYFFSTRGVAKEYTETMTPPSQNKLTFLGVDFFATGGNNSRDHSPPTVDYALAARNRTSRHGSPHATTM